MICKVIPDDEMIYLTDDYTIDEYGVKHPSGKREIVDMIGNPLSIINRTIPMVIIEGSITFILDRARKHAATMEDPNEAMEFMFDVLRILNPKETKKFEDIYESLSPVGKKHFIQDCISIDNNGLLITNNGLYTKWEAFNTEYSLRDAIIKVYEKYGDIIKPYHIFMPKPKWGRDIYVGDDHIGFQYTLTLKQSGEKGFSVRSSGSINDESLPEKNSKKKQGKSWYSSKPIRFGEYETPRNYLGVNPFNCWKLLRV